MQTILLITVLVFLTLALLWSLVPAFYGLPSVPTRPDRIRAALRLADLRAGEAFVDLGCGDGRALVIAAREFGARATGIDIGPVQCLVSWGNALVSGVRSRVRVRCENYYRANISDADLVFIYATSRQLIRLEPHLKRQLRDGARVVTVGSDIHEWRPEKTDLRELIFLYGMPPQYSRTI